MTYEEIQYNKERITVNRIVILALEYLQEKKHLKLDVQQIESMPGYGPMDPLSTFYILTIQYTPDQPPIGVATWDAIRHIRVMLSSSYFDPHPMPDDSDVLRTLYGKVDNTKYTILRLVEKIYQGIKPYITKPKWQEFSFD